MRQTRASFGSAKERSDLHENVINSDPFDIASAANVWKIIRGKLQLGN